MTIENDTPQGGGGATVPAAAVTTTPALRSDAEAEQLAQAAQGEAPNAEAEAAEKARKDAEAAAGERKKNRTREYINRINSENAELRRRLMEREQPGQPPAQQPAAQRAQPADAEPTLEQHNFDVEAFTKAHNKWAIEQDRKARDESSKQEASTRQQREVMAGYEAKVAAFADEHPDFMEAVGSIQFPLAMEVQLAIMAHENGPAIAYHIANNDDDAFFLASTQPHLAAAAVERLASRMTAAPQEVPNAPAATTVATQAPTKPISQAPAPTPTVSGRAPTETPPEKLTDDEWFKREQERSRKR